ncbi:hypothetical protein [Sphingobium sp. TomMM35A]
MSILPHAAAALCSAGMILGAGWFIYVHLRAYGDQIMAALMYEGPR